MKEIKVSKKGIEKNQFKTLINVLKKDGLIALKTDTIYGFSCLASSSSALKKLRQLKKREKDKPFLLLVANLEMLESIAFLNLAQKKYLEDNRIFEEKSTTILLKIKKKLPIEVLGSKNINKVAIRLPKSRFLTKMIKELDEPIVSSSLNLSGKENISNPREIKKIFSQENGIDLILNSGICRRRKASRLIDLSDLKNIKVIRN